MHTTIRRLEEKLPRDPRLALKPLVAAMLKYPSVQLAVGAGLEGRPLRRLGDVSG